MKGWERYVRTKLDEGFDVTVTGSNASVFAKEPGTKLTGRHVDCELFPFDYGEYLAFVNASEGAGATGEYLRRGGFPAYLTSGDERLLETLFEDILVRDVVVRHGIREVDALRRLASYLVENISCRISATRLRQPLSISSTATILKWCDYLSDAYLFDFVPIYSASVKVQMVNPRKAYCIDTGLRHVLSASTAPDDARAFENMVYLALRRVCRDIFYFDDGGECDFVCMEHHLPRVAVQACVKLTKEDSGREKEGLAAAMRRFSFNEGFIVTKSQREDIKVDEGVLHVVPFSDFEP
jgi:predicted AAA+ superfamily ATPase